MGTKTDDAKKVYNSMFNLINIPQYFIESQNPLEEWNLFFKKNRSQIRNFDRNYENLINEFFKGFDLSDENLFKFEFYKVYIPSLRGLLLLIPDRDIYTNEGTYSIFDFIEEDIFAQRVKNDYFRGTSKIMGDIVDSDIGVDKIRNSIITGHYFYKYVQEFLLGDLRQREIIKHYQEYLSENFFHGQEVTLIPKLEDSVLTVKIGHENERKIYDLGEGIQSIILITLPLFLYLNKSEEFNTNVLVFIEEPEIGLHPSLQRKLMETFLDDKFKNFQFFFTTHSNHFIDNIFKDKDVSVYSFDKHVADEEDSQAEFTIQNVGFNHVPTMKRLGALPSSVLMNNCIVMIEGTTDKKHYELYLDLYQGYLQSQDSTLRKFKEGIHYSFLRGGGSEAIETIKEFNDIEKERIFNVFDNDSEEDTSRKKGIFSQLEYDNYYFLNVKEVENLVSLDSIVNTIKKVYNISDREIHLDFDENEYYQCNDFYDFIIENMFDGVKPNKFPKKDNKGKLKDQLAKKENQFVNNFEDLTEEAKKVAIEIYKFVKRSNPN